MDKLYKHIPKETKIFQLHKITSALKNMNKKASSNQPETNRCNFFPVLIGQFFGD